MTVSKSHAAAKAERTMTRWSAAYEAWNGKPAPKITFADGWVTIENAKLGGPEFAKKHRVDDVRRMADHLEYMTKERSDTPPMG
ncbi:hypothetical protein LOKG_00069 [Loktanella phage pCB2051-A]|uniref:Uncharacterized protein n=1 Tax=Loktanella phage pCB2051-A TaxID=754044 RepID=M4QPG3_9CAUD|nr:hypothetical protein LOKG_00069 [Loktanella phage pCB2051-A]AGH31505.1 hypothetical protein LOKG_00069 [Loktanella phage pCB2051-A]